MGQGGQGAQRQVRVMRVGLAALLIASSALAQPYPARPVKFVVPFPPGGGVDIVARAKREPGGLTFASSGTGGIIHLTGEMFKQAAGIDLTHVPYKGTTQILPDVLDGRIDLALDSVPAYLPHIKAGRVKVFAVASRNRSALFPDLPTMAEAGVPGVVAATDYALYVPAGTRKDVIARLHRETAAVLEDADLRRKLAAQAIEVRGGTPQELKAELAGEIEKWGRVIQAANIKPE